MPANPVAPESILSTREVRVAAKATCVPGPRLTAVHPGSEFSVCEPPGSPAPPVWASAEALTAAADAAMPAAMSRVAGRDGTSRDNLTISTPLEEPWRPPAAGDRDRTRVGGDRAEAPLLRALEQGGGSLPARGARVHPRPGDSCPRWRIRSIVHPPKGGRRTDDRLRFPPLTGVRGGQPAAC